VFARYWLHGKGPAPAGNMPVAVHLSPSRLALDDGRPAALRLTVACGPEPASGVIDLDMPDGVSVRPAGPLKYDLPPLGHLSWDLALQAARAGPAGRRFAAARVTDPCGQLVEDSVLLTVGQPAAPQPDLPLAEVVMQQQAVDAAVAGEVELSMAATRITVRTGETGVIEVLLANRCDSAIRGEAQLLSPYGSWQQAGPWTDGFTVPAGASATLRFQVTAAATARPGERWWAIVKVMYFGRLKYTEPAEVTIG
jgi:hypothetical protein